MKKLLTLGVLFCVLAWASCVLAGAADVRVIKISPDDERAVVQVPGKPLSLVKPGDRLPGYGLITEIAEGRIVCRFSDERGPQTVIVRVSEKGQSVERISSVPEQRPVLQAPVTSEQSK